MATIAASETFSGKSGRYFLAVFFASLSSAKRGAVLVGNGKLLLAKPVPQKALILELLKGGNTTQTFRLFCERFGILNSLIGPKRSSGRERSRYELSDIYNHR